MVVSLFLNSLEIKEIILLKRRLDALPKREINITEFEKLRAPLLARKYYGNVALQWIFDLYSNNVLVTEAIKQDKMEIPLDINEIEKAVIDFRNELIRLGKV